MKYFLAVLAVINLLLMIGDGEQKNRDNYTYGFMVTVAGLVAVHLIG